ncbi:MAG: SLOG family protein [Clostridia bacterium]|nr:SLOG family protein [Clostridia bacterium]
MSEITLVKEYTCAFSGHRNVKSDLKKEEIVKLIDNMIERGIDTFLVGMAVGFDMLCFSILEKVRKRRNIRIIACIPCENQAEKYSVFQKKEYERMKKSADEVIYCSKEYSSYCMQKRNMFMVDNSKYLIAYLRQNKGGTFNTVSYANKKGVEIIIV